MEEDIETCGWFVFYKDQLLIEKKNGMYTIPFGTEPPMPVPVGSTIHTIGEIEGRTAKTFSVHAPVPGSENDRHLMMDLRSSYDVLPWEEYNVGGKAFQILNWDKNRICSSHCIDRKHTQRRRTIDDDKVIIIFHFIQSIFQNIFFIFFI